MYLLSYELCYWMEMILGSNDYVGISQQFTFLPGVTAISISIDTVDDFELAELNETFLVVLFTSSEILTIGEIDTANITIVDNDRMPNVLHHRIVLAFSLSLLRTICDIFPFYIQYN